MQCNFSIVTKMLHLTTLCLLSVWTLCQANVIQPPMKEVPAGANLTLQCDHSSINPADYIHWYRQTPDEQPKFLIRALKDTVSDLLTITFSKDRKSSELHIQNVKTEESGVYLCALSDTAVQPNTLSVQ
ncbi:hypothetical protein XELAEV_18010273mg [Xenopus laevis]|uniref:Ig-like domain-containing protein n=1 Tax=Xenopus laevis TaxID=8355 RepID=A0A974I1N6_XENLA|nr:hypothetical protein XELAEV_18010273mg [Xenopus laevis]